MKSHWPISILSTISSAINMLLPLALVRMLTPDEIGQFKIFFLYVTVFPAFAFASGMTNGLSYWAGHGERGKSMIRLSGRAILVAALTFLLLCLALHAPLENWLNWGPRETVIFSIAIFGQIAAAFFEDSSIALGRVWQGALFGAAWDFVRTVSILLTGLITRSVPAIFLAHTLTLVLKTLVAYTLVERGLLRGASIPGGKLSHELKAILSYAMPVSLASLFAIFVNYSDQMLLSSFITPAEFAFYSIGCLSVPPLMILEYSITRVLIPQLSTSFQSGQPAQAARLYSKAVEELTFFMIPSIAGLAVFAAPIILMLFTSKFAGAEQYLRVYAFGYLALAFPYDSIPRARGQGRWIFWNFFGFSTLSLALCYLMIQKFGPMGALVGGLGARLLMRIYGVLYIRRDTGWHFKDFLPLDSIFRYTTTATVLGLICWLCRDLFVNPLHWFLVMGAFFSVAYFAILGIWGRMAFRKGKQSPKVLMVTQYLGLGGLERMIFNLSESLKSQGHWQPQVFVYEHQQYSAPDTHLGPAFEGAGIPVTYFTKAKGFSFKAVARIAHTVLQQDISVIHTHDLGSLIYGSFAKMVCLGRVRLVHTQHSFVHLARKRRYQLYEKFFTRFADEITVVSRDTLATYRELGVPEAKIKVIPNGVHFAEMPGGGPVLYAEKSHARRQALESLIEKIDSENLTRSLGSMIDAHWILYMARLHGRKGQDQAMKLWGCLAPEIRQKSILLFVGLETDPGQADLLRKLIQEAPDRDRVLYLGASQQPQLWLKSAEVFLSSSEFEGMPLASIEACGSGLPLILSDIPGHRTFTGTNCRYYQLEHPEQGAQALSAALADIERDPATFFERAWQEAKQVRSTYSVAAMAALYGELYPWRRS